MESESLATDVARIFRDRNLSIRSNCSYAEVD